MLHRPVWKEHLFEPPTRYYTQTQLLDIWVQGGKNSTADYLSARRTWHREKEKPEVNRLRFPSHVIFRVEGEENDQLTTKIN